MASGKRKLVCSVVREICVQLSRELQHILENNQNKKKRRWWVRQWILRRNTHGASGRLLKELAIEDTEAYRNHLRMDEANFELLLQKVIPKIQKQNTLLRDALPACLKLQVTLRYLATGDNFSTLSGLYRVPKNSISQFLPDVCEAIYDCLQEYIRVSR